ncbi:MAG: hypothetical protein HY366_02605 [Candidatus Aenigmarchaeota archaeon]|nr:hypothetical protein [Candidatus Aenigmarchaeota archaeon]
MTELAHMHKDLEELKRDVSLIKHILSQEGAFTKEAKKRLADARKTQDSEYVRLG